MKFKIDYQIQWRDVDVNQHVRSTVYSELGVHARVCFLEQVGLSPDAFSRLRVGPVLMREEIFYRRELHFLEKVEVSCEVSKFSKDYKKFAFTHQIRKKSGQLAAEIIAEGVWLDLTHRKAIAPPPEIKTPLESMKLPETFKWW